MKKPTTVNKATTLFKKNGGVLRTREALSLGISPKTLYTMQRQGLIDAVSRGVFLLNDESIDIQHIDLLVASKRLPKGVVCLISALSFHQLTTEIPHAVYLAYQQGWRTPQVDYPPIKVFRYSKEAYELGIEVHKINTVAVRVYGAAKTVVDCFKFRNKVGLDVAIAALRDYWQTYPGAKMDDILQFAEICRVKKIIMPYLESITYE